MSSSEFQELCECHFRLLELVDLSVQSGAPVLTEIDELVVQLRAVGRSIDDEAQRRQLNEYLRVWGSYLYNCRGSQCPFAEIMPYVKMNSPDMNSLSSKEGAIGAPSVQNITVKGPFGHHQDIGTINYFDRIELTLYILNDPRVPEEVRRILNEEMTSLRQAPLILKYSDLLTDMLDLIQEQIVLSGGTNDFRMELKRRNYSDTVIETLEEVMSPIRQRVSELEQKRQGSPA